MRVPVRMYINNLNKYNSCWQLVPLLLESEFDISVELRMELPDLNSGVEMTY
jgi:hypothetical protein